MRFRGVLLVALVAAIVAGIVLSRPEKPTYEFDAVFDTARGIVPGQLVKVAGSRVGRISEVNLTNERKASFRLKIDPKFGPFRADASCKILPEGFISESFIQCDPGTPGKPELASAAGHRGVPTVPVERTEASVQLQQVIDTFSLPVDERIRVVLGELGIASGGRGQDLNALLRRANPALGQARRLLDVLAQQKQALNGAVDGTDAVLATLATSEKDVDRFVDRAAAVTKTTDEHRDGLGRSIRSLPAMLREVDASLGTLRSTADRLTPTARELRAAAPQLGRANSVLRELSDTGRPALNALSPAVRQTRMALPSTRPLVTELASLGSRLKRPSKLGSDLFGSLRETGGIEQLENFVYTLATVSGTFDSVSHLVPINLLLAPRCFLDISQPGCRHTFTSPKNGQIPINNPDYPLTDTERSKQGTTAPKAGDLPSLDDLPAQTQRGLRKMLDGLLK